MAGELGHDRGTATCACLYGWTLLTRVLVSGIASTCLETSAATRRFSAALTLSFIASTSLYNGDDLADPPASPLGGPLLIA